MKLPPWAATLAVLSVMSAPASAQQLITRTPPVSVTLIGVHAVDDRVVWASGQRGTWVRTTDGGATWTTGRVPGADTLEFRDVDAVSADTAWLPGIGNGGPGAIPPPDWFAVAPGVDQRPVHG